MPQKEILLIGDVIRDILIPEEGRIPLVIDKESDVEETLARTNAVEMIGGAAFVHRMLTSLIQLHEEKEHGKKDTCVSMDTHPGHYDKSERLKGPDWDNYPILSTPFTTHWTLKRFPETLADKENKIYRVHERSVGQVGTLKGNEKYSFNWPNDPRNPRKPHSLLVIQDYDRGLRYELKKEVFEGLMDGRMDPIKCVIGVGSRLPDVAFRDESRRLMSQGGFWDAFLGDSESMTVSDKGLAKNTVVITSLDRLRQDSAYVSKRKSWDRTVDDFIEELDYFPPLQQLTKFRHLVVRVGVSAAFLVSNRKAGRRVRFFYDPHAPGAVYRDLRFQGNTFFVRSTFSAVLALAALKINRSIGNPSEEPGDGECRDMDDAIKEGMRLNQYLFKKGFGRTLGEVRSFTSRWAKGKLLDKNTFEELRNQIINVSTPPQSPHVQRWGLLTGNMQCEISDFPTKEPNRAVFLEKLHWLEVLRRFRCAKLIVMGGLHAAVNQRCTPKTLLNETDQSKLLDGQLKFEREAFARPTAADGLALRRQLVEISQLGFEDYFSPGEQYFMGKSEALTYAEFATKNSAQLNRKLKSGVKCPTSDIGWVDAFKELTGRGNYLKVNGLFRDSDKTEIERPVRAWEWIHDRLVELYDILSGTYPFNFPVAKFGDLLAASQFTVEGYTSVKNLIRGYIKALPEQKRPLCLAVFGPPGSGKSFGIKEIASELASNLDVIECNLTQIEDREDLGRVFFRVANSLSLHRLPLVFFDEFDASNGEALFPWLKHFLQPMQDGDFRHLDGKINVTPAIFVFAGGTSANFEAFEARTVTRSGQDAKGPDFISRLRAHLNIPAINPDPENGYSPHDKKGSYISRALMLRSQLKRKGFVEEPDYGLGDRRKDVGLAKIDGDIARALITVSRFRHGARSIEALLDTFQAMQGRIVKASLPTLSQLNMHTQGIEFLVRIRYPHLHWFHERIAVFGNWDKISRGSYDPKSIPDGAVWRKFEEFPQEAISAETNEFLKGRAKRFANSWGERKWSQMGLEEQFDLSRFISGKEGSTILQGISDLEEGLFDSEIEAHRRRMGAQISNVLERLTVAVKNRGTYCGFGEGGKRADSHFHYRIRGDKERGFRFIFIVNDWEFLEMAVTIDGNRDPILWYLFWGHGDREVPATNTLNEAWRRLADVGHGKDGKGDSIR